MRSGIGRAAVFVLCVALIAAAIIVIAVICSSLDGHKGEILVPAVVEKGGGRDASDGPVAWPPMPKAEENPSRRPYDSSNVFVRLPSGAIVRQGESIPPLEDEDREAAELRAASDEWEKIVKACSGDTRTNGRKVRYAEFARALGRFPKERRGENLKYAINLMDDANFLLVATLALDRDQPDDIIALAFDACLNRDRPESRAVIEEISKDKSHPMYVDAARVMDVKRLAEGTLSSMPNSAR